MVFQACQNPFVLQMDYALQTENHAIIVLNLVTSGNLQVPKLDDDLSAAKEQCKLRTYDTGCDDDGECFSFRAPTYFSVLLRVRFSFFVCLSIDRWR